MIYNPVTADNREVLYRFDCCALVGVSDISVVIEMIVDPGERLIIIFIYNKIY